MIDPDVPPNPPALRVEEMQDTDPVIRAVGSWDIPSLERLPKQPDAKITSKNKGLSIDLTSLDRLDTAGAIALIALRDRLKNDGRSVAFTGPDARVDLVAAIDKADCPPKPPEPGGSIILQLVARMGKATIDVVEEGKALLSFLGLVTYRTWRSILLPGSVRVTALVHHIEQTGLNAIPIVGLLAFLIGVVVAYQGADVLRQFGAEPLVVDLLGISILREMGILMTSIIVAGRSGSAFTAQIGTMQVNQEIDAMRTMGLDPVRFLVVPRVLALIVTLPLLTFFANAMALLGGALMAWVVLDFSLGSFWLTFQEKVPINNFWVGMMKAPVFAFVIALVGCYQGFKVTGSAQSVGRRTTASVVEAIFLVITLDALFSIFFSLIGY